jgi:hypothetical protein
MKQIRARVSWSHLPYMLITEPGASGSIYAGLSNGDIWASNDQGASWRQLPVNLGGIHRSLVMVWGEALRLVGQA